MAATSITLASGARPVVARQQTRRAAQAGVSGLRATTVARPAPKSAFAPSLTTPRRASVETKAAVEVATVAGEVAEIAGTAGVMFVCTLVGLAVGFVMLRVESLVEEGKI
eukprot:CAMPEP_0117663450 /NCGR_PEP_ID=MMETSP0804-20121206/8614_1 /TAXON_ID=1074897 /ORGANISM="Tetraselmis astigmatica, Strain CCMP880" /LENGTH=109 /DNA_ID=CAMNT_0005470459 /DNA_START=101 /DNA_END=430 /DNA_ORIENTATION=+